MDPDEREYVQSRQCDGSTLGSGIAAYTASKDILDARPERVSTFLAAPQGDVAQPRPSFTSPSGGVTESNPHAASTSAPTDLHPVQFSFLSSFPSSFSSSSFSPLPASTGALCFSSFSVSFFSSALCF